MTPELSVVIPTYNRKETITRVLDALGRQTLPREAFEVLVVDDGSRDGTTDVLKSSPVSFDLAVMTQENTGPAGARNRGVRASRGEIVVFLGDDTVPEPEFLDVHLRSHREAGARKIAVLGYTGWPRERRVTPFLHHINEYGLQFGYELIDDPDSVPFNFFYTSNISVPRRALRGRWTFRHDLSRCGVGRHRAFVSALSKRLRDRLSAAVPSSGTITRSRSIRFADGRNVRVGRRRSSIENIPSSPTFSGWARRVSKTRACRFHCGSGPAFANAGRFPAGGRQSIACCGPITCGA